MNVFEESICRAMLIDINQNKNMLFKLEFHSNFTCEHNERAFMPYRTYII